MTLSFNSGGRHDMKLGGEYLYAINAAFGCLYCMGRIDAQGGPIPANIEELFPVWDDVSTWNLAALSPIVRRYTFGTGQFANSLPEYNAAGWVQDDWQITSRLTLNLGLRYDLAMNVFANEVILPPIITEPRPNDTNNFQPRFGFAYTPDRSHRSARRLRAILRRPHHGTRRPDERPGGDGCRGHSERRPARLPGEPVQRAVADEGAARTAVLLRQSRARVYPA